MRPRPSPVEVGADLTSSTSAREVLDAHDRERRRRRLQRALVLALVVVALLVILPSFWAPLGFDEGYNLQVVVNLLHGRGYATNAPAPSTRPDLFDYQVTTGPTLMLPISAMAGLLGRHVWTYRLAPALFYSLLLWCWWRLGKDTYGPLAGVAAAAGVLAIQGFALTSSWPGAALGESTSTACAMAALLAIRHPRRCGALAGLAVMAKVVMLLALPAIAVAVVVEARRRRLRMIAVLTPWSACVAAPIVMWQLVRIATVGWTGNVNADRDFLTFLREDGGGHVGVLSHALAQMLTLTDVGVALVLVSAGAIIVRWSQRSRRLPLGDLDPRLWGAAASGLTLELWWLVLEGQGWPRHSIQATQLLLPLLLIGTVAALRGLDRPPLRRVLTAAVAGLVVAQLVSVTRSEWFTNGRTLGDQRQVANLVSKYAQTYHYLDVDPHQLPVLNESLRSGPLTSHGGLLVLNEQVQGSSVATCDRVLERYAGYVICWVRPSG